MIKKGTDMDAVVRGDFLSEDCVALPKPCPFCGKEISIRYGTNVWEQVFECSDCGVTMVVHTTDEEEAVAKWNKRFGEVD